MAKYSDGSSYRFLCLLYRFRAPNHERRIANFSRKFIGLHLAPIGGRVFEWSDSSTVDEVGTPRLCRSECPPEIGDYSWSEVASVAVESVAIEDYCPREDLWSVTVVYWINFFLGDCSNGYFSKRLEPTLKERRELFLAITRNEYGKLSVIEIMDNS